MPTDPNAQKIIDACKANWEAHKSDCSGFAKAVATALEITGLTGQANDIYAELLSKEWTELKDGVEAKAKADAGLFVLAALTGAQHDPPQTHGHVAVVVTGPLAHDKYPTGYWGSLGSVGMENMPLNYAWNAPSRDKLRYACQALLGTEPEG